MTPDRPTSTFAPDTSRAKIVSIIDEIRTRKIGINLEREPERIASEYGDCWYHDAAIQRSKEVH